MFNLFRDFFSHKAEYQMLFSRTAQNAVAMARLLEQAVDTSDTDAREILFKQINTLESTGDDITHKIYLVLDKGFFTPLNRKDIHTLASVIDDVADHIDEASGRIQLYQVEQYLPAFKQLSAHITAATLKLEEIVTSLLNIRDMEYLLQQCKNIKKIEHEADIVYYHALADLFANEKNAIELIKYRDILHSLETSVNKCKSVTDVLEIILLNGL